MTDYLEMLREKTADQPEAKCEPDAVQFTHCPYCDHELRPPSIAIQIENFRLFQLAHGTIYIWSPDEMKRLAEQMCPDDILLLPAYTYSVRIRRPDGSIYVVERR